MLRPFLKWPGGKSGELAGIAAAAPAIAGRFIDLFVGGGSVLLAVPAAVPAWANDACDDLVDLYRAAASGDADTLGVIEALAAAWDGLGDDDALYDELTRAFRTRDPARAMAALTTGSPALVAPVSSAGDDLASAFRDRLEREVPPKLLRMERVEARAGWSLSDEDLRANVEGAVRAALYLAVRARYNEARSRGERGPPRTADFLFLRELAYAAMFRFNAQGGFNVPYGGVSYNSRSLLARSDALTAPGMVARLRATTWRCQDFAAFLEAAAPTPDDLVFVDPPYDSDFSTYDNQRFTWHDQVRLRDLLATLPCAVLLVIKDTPRIRELYAAGPWTITSASKTYLWTIKSRNERRTTHLTISNR